MLSFYNHNSVKNYLSTLVLDSGSGEGCYIFDNYNLMDKLTVNIKSNYLVSEHNADEVVDNTYTWVITKDNYKKKNIYIKIDKSREVLSAKKEERIKKIMVIVLISLGISVIIFALFTFVKIRKSSK